LSRRRPRHVDVDLRDARILSMAVASSSRCTLTGLLSKREPDDAADGSTRSDAGGLREGPRGQTDHGPSPDGGGLVPRSQPSSRRLEEARVSRPAEPVTELDREWHVEDSNAVRKDV